MLNLHTKQNLYDVITNKHRHTIYVSLNIHRHIIMFVPKSVVSHLAGNLTSESVHQLLNAVVCEDRRVEKELWV